MDNAELNQSSKIRDYKIVCAKLGFIMCVYYACRFAVTVIVGLIYQLIDEIGYTAAYITQSAVQVMLIYMVPILVTAIVFKSFSYYDGILRKLYEKPRRLAHALGNFPAMYGLGQGVNFLTLLSGFAISKIIGGENDITKYFEPAIMERPPNLISAVVAFVLLVFIAPVLEEFLTRGIFYDALKPFGCGTAIVISSLLFGFMHGNLRMLFYTTALGLALGYVRYATNSLFVTTVLHAIFNFISAGMFFLSSLTVMTNEENKLINTVLNIYLLTMAILIIVGLAAFFKKIPVIRKYKIENEWGDIGARKKTALFITSWPIIIMLIITVAVLYFYS